MRRDRGMLEMRRETELREMVVILWHRRRCWEDVRRRWIVTESLSADVCAARVHTAKGDFRPLPEGHCRPECVCGVTRGLK